MKFIPATCPQCKGALQLPDNIEIAKCTYCGTDIVLRDFISNIQQNVNIQALLVSAQRAGESGNHSEAYRLYSKILEHDHNHIQALIGKGASAGWSSTLAHMRFPEMITCFKAAIEVTPESQKTEYKMQAAQHLKDVSAAICNFAGDHALKYAALDDTWPELISRTEMVIQMNEIALQYNEDDQQAMENIIIACQNLLQGMSYRTYQGVLAVHHLPIDKKQKLTSLMNKYAYNLQKLNPKYILPPIEEAKDGLAGSIRFIAIVLTCCLIVVFLLVVGFFVFAIYKSKSTQQSPSARALSGQRILSNEEIKLLQKKAADFIAARNLKKWRDEGIRLGLSASDLDQFVQKKKDYYCSHIIDLEVKIKQDDAGNIVDVEEILPRDANGQPFDPREQ